MRAAAHLPRPTAAGVPKRRMRARLAGSFVPNLTRKAFERYGFATPSLITDWPAIVGARLSAVTQPERLKWPRNAARIEDIDETNRNRPGATLVCRVHPAAALDIEYSAGEIVGRVNGYLGYRAVAKLHVVQDPHLKCGPSTSADTASPKAQQAAFSGSSAQNPQSSVQPQSALQAALARLEANVFGRTAG